MARSATHPGAWYRIPAVPRWALLGLIWVLSATVPARAEDGYDLWLRYRPVESPWMAGYRSAATELVGAADTARLRAAQDELTRALTGLLGRAPPARSAVTRDGAILFGTPRSSPLIARLGLDLSGTATEGYLIRNVSIGGRRAIVIAANEDTGVLYGVFGFLRLLQTRQWLQRLDLAAAPRTQLRPLNHWDNLDESIDRGYAGASIWDWHKLPDYLDPRYRDYARACASVGINGTVLNSVQ